MSQKKNFAIIGPPTQNTNDLRDAIHKLGGNVSVFGLKDVRFEMRSNSAKAFYGEKDIVENFDIVIFRGFNLRMLEAQMLAKMLVEKKKTILEQNLSSFFVWGKLQQAKILTENGISHPATFHASSEKSWEEIFEKIKFPVIAKPNDGCKGKGLKKLDSKEDARKFFLHNCKGYIVQEYFPIKSDYRIFIVNDKVIGGFERFIFEGEYKSNIHGTHAKKIDVSEEMAKLAIDGASACGYEVAGVDIMEHEGKLYIIEVNVAPQWEKFKKVTGINPAEHIIKYAIEKYIKR